jgi:hypothetical protein
MLVRIYEDSGTSPSSEPVATVNIAVPGESATRSQQFDRSATFALVGVESTNPAVRERVRAALTRASIPVTRSLVSVRGAVRTRGEGRAEAPQGTAEYWRAALAFPFENDLRSDPADYASLLAAIDPPLPEAVPAPAPQAYPEPIRATDPGQWYAALLSVLDQLAAAQLTRSAVPIRTRGTVVRGGEPVLRGGPVMRGGGAGQVPVDPELINPIVERLRTDPEFLKAVANLGLAMALPERPKVLESLEAFAQRAQSHEAHTD